MCLGGAKEYTVSYFSSAKKICCFRSQVHSDFCNISFVHFHVTLFSRHVMVLPTSPSYLCKLQASLCTLVELTIDSGSRHWLSTGASACILKLTVGSWLTAALALSFSSYVFGITHCCIFRLLAIRDVPCQPSKFQHYSFIFFDFGAALSAHKAKVTTPDFGIRKGGLRWKWQDDMKWRKNTTMLWQIVCTWRKRRNTRARYALAGTRPEA